MHKTENEKGEASIGMLRRLQNRGFEGAAALASTPISPAIFPSTTEEPRPQKTTLLYGKNPVE